MQKVFPEHILKKLSISNKHMKLSSRNFLLFFSLILMVIALARPVMDKKEHEIEQEVTPIVVAIDVSKSMLAHDIYPNRLTFAKNKLLKIIEHSQHNALGVLLFAKSAFILSPITQDFNSLKYLVQNFDNGLNFDNGSNIMALIEASNKLFRNYKNKNLLILTDGANKEDFSKEINFANDKNINIYTLATASTKPTPIKIGDKFLTDSNENIVTVALNDKIKELSLKTDGGYITYSLNDSDIKAILNDIETKSSKDTLNSKKYKTYTELFYYPLGLGLFILLFAFSSLPTKKVAFVLLFCSFIQKDAHASMASILDFQSIKKANEAYVNSDFETSSKEFKKVSHTKEANYNLANSLYKEKKYEEALKEYKKITTSNKDLEYKKLHNMGNSYVKLQKLEDAKKMYEKALTIKEDKETNENLETVKKALKNQKKQNKSGNKKSDKDNKDKKKENQDKKKSQQDKKDKKDKKEKNKKKDSKEKENKKSKSDDKSDKTDKSDSKKKNKQTKEFKEQKAAEEKLKNEQISDLEEKKWMKKIQNKKTPVLLRKVESKHQEDNVSTPW